MGALDLTFQGGEASLSVRRFSVHEAVSTPYTVSIWARSANPAIDLGGIVGQPAGFQMMSGLASVDERRGWNGVVSFMEQTRAERREQAIQSTYLLRIVPRLWLLSQRRDHRIFQHLSIPDIVDGVLDAWSLERVWRIDRGSYPKHELKVQYGESDLAFLSRLLEEAGIAYTFPEDQQSKLTFDDALHQRPTRAGAPLPYEESPLLSAERAFVSRVRLVLEVRPGAVTLRDHDFRKPSFALLGEAKRGTAPEDGLEHYHYLPGGFFVETDAPGDTPVADDQGVARHDLDAGRARATRMLESARADRAGITLESNVHDLYPGVVVAIDHHPHPDLKRKLLLTDVVHEGTAEGAWEVQARAVFADVPYRPPLVTPRPNVLGVQSATVVGPASDGAHDAIHTDEFGRVRVQFPWDRDGSSDELSSCWIRVSEGWGGAGYGWLALPRVGHEVLVTFLEGDPDRPMVSGRLYNASHPVPYSLPAHKTVSTWKSDASGGYNEIKFEDLKGGELLYIQAEKNLRKLVNSDEIDTVGGHRDKSVGAVESEVVDGFRMQWVRDERHQRTGRERMTQIKGNRHTRIRGDASEVNDAFREQRVLGDHDSVVRGEKRERDEWDFHTRVLGDRRERVGLDASMTVLQERHETVGGSYAREAGSELHLVAGKVLVGEAPDLTLKGPGGFLRIDAMGVTISGTKVDINVSGSPGQGHGAQPKEVVEAKEAQTQAASVAESDEGPGHSGSAVLVEQAADAGEGEAPAALPSMALVTLARSADVSTPAGGAVLMSGGAVAGAAARQLADRRAQGGQASALPEDTAGGKQIAAASGDAPWAETSAAWAVLSTRLAAEASGEVNVVVTGPLGGTASLRETMRTLAANEKVSDVKVWALATDAQGAPALDASGNFLLQPHPMRRVLASAPTKRKS